MDESTIKGMKLLQLKDNESSDAAIQEIRAKSCSSRTTRRHGTVDVTGYDHSLPEDDIERALIKHFSSCGEVAGVVVFTRICNARVVIKGEGAAEKALKLSGCNSGCECDVLGCKFVAHKYIPQPTVRGNQSTGYTVPGWCIQKAAKRAKV